VNHKHAVTNYNGNAYTYDGNGDQTGRFIDNDGDGVYEYIYALVYDGESRLVDDNYVDTQNIIHHTYFTYDADGRRIKVEIQAVDGQTVTTTTKIIYVGGIYEKNILTAEITKYYREGATLVSMRKGTVRSELLTDNLGSVTESYPVGGGTTTHQRYFPWGAIRPGPNSSNALATDYTYTGQKSDSYINLMWYGSRWFDPELGRFIQADSIVPNVFNPLDLDRYQYVRSNPVNFNDPSGHKACSNDGNSFDECSDPLGDDLTTLTGEQKLAVINQIAVILQSQGGDSLAAFQNLLNVSSHLYKANDKINFMKDMTCIIIGFCGGNSTDVYKIGLKGAYPDSPSSKYFLGLNFFQGQGSWSDKYYDYSDNQMYHFWFYVAVSYFNGAFVAWAGDFYHDPSFSINLEINGNPISLEKSPWVTSLVNDGRSMQDYLLGLEGARLGFLLSTNLIQVSEIGNGVFNVLSSQ
jgi:RHS repeat-associated protein